MSSSSDSLTDDSGILARAGRYIWKNRGKILAGGAVVAAGYAVYHYYSAPKKAENGDGNQQLVTSGDRNTRGSAASKPGDRSRMLLRIRKQFDVAIKQFLPTMRLKVLELIDVASAVKKIKELRAMAAKGSDGQSNSRPQVTEAMLWEEVKISSLTLLYVSAYMVSAVTVLLRIQLHILGKSFHMLSASQFISDEQDLDKMGGDIFRFLIEGTYKHIFSAGLQQLADIVRQRVTDVFQEWTVREKVEVEYAELAQLTMRVRKSIESDSSALIKLIMLPPEADLEAGVGASSFASSAGAHKDTVQHLLAQTWDVLESPVLSKCFTEATDVCFRSVFSILRMNMFAPEGDAGVSLNMRGMTPTRVARSLASLRKPPLASLLPQLKGVAMKLLPADTNAVTVEVREIVASPALDSLCISLFDIGNDVPTGAEDTSMNTTLPRLRGKSGTAGVKVDGSAPPATSSSSSSSSSSGDAAGANIAGGGGVGVGDDVTSDGRPRYTYSGPGNGKQVKFTSENPNHADQAHVDHSIMGDTHWYRNGNGSSNPDFMFGKDPYSAYPSDSSLYRNGNGTSTKISREPGSESEALRMMRNGNGTSTRDPDPKGELESSPDVIADWALAYL